MDKTTLKLDREDETRRFAFDFSKNLKAGDVVELVGDVGSGKTFFVRSLAEALGATGVSSPSFVIKNEYSTGKFPIMHYDFYRLEEPGIIRDELSESLSGQNLVIIEWAGSIEGVLPPERYRIQFKVTGDQSRELTITI